MLTPRLRNLDKRIRPVVRYEEQLEGACGGGAAASGQVQTVTNTVADLSKRTEDRLQSIVYWKSSGVRIPAALPRSKVSCPDCANA